MITPRQVNRAAHLHYPPNTNPAFTHAFANGALAVLWADRPDMGFAAPTDKAELTAFQTGQAWARRTLSDPTEPEEPCPPPRTCPS